MLDRQNRFNRDSPDKRSLSEGSKPKTNHNDFLKFLYGLGLPERATEYSSDGNRRRKSLPSRFELPETRLVEKVKSIARFTCSDYTTIEDICKYIYSEKESNRELKIFIKNEIKDMSTILVDINAIAKQNLIIYEKYGNIHNKQFFDNITEYIKLSEKFRNKSTEIIKKSYPVLQAQYAKDLQKLHFGIIHYSENYREYKESRRSIGLAFDKLATAYNEERQSLKNTENPSLRSQKAVAIDRAYFKVADRLIKTREKYRKRDKVLQRWKEDLLKRAEGLLRKKQDCQQWQARLDECWDSVISATYSL